MWWKVRLCNSVYYTFNILTGEKSKNLFNQTMTYRTMSSRIGVEKSQRHGINKIGIHMIKLQSS